MRSPDQESIDYHKAFKKAKTDAEKIHIAKQAASDPNFSPCKPDSMSYLASETEPTVLLDVDQCLLKGAGLNTIVNTKQIHGLIKQGFTQGYLFSSMSPDNATRIEENDLSRIALIAYMALSGFIVRGVYTQADAAQNAKRGDFYKGYYNTIMQIPSKKRLIDSMTDNFNQSEMSRMAYFSGENDTHDRISLFGAKTQMFKAFLENNPNIKDIWIVDDALPNLLGALKILRDKQMAGQFLDVTLHLCPVDKNTWGEDYNKLFEKHRTRKNQMQAASISEAQLLFSMMAFALDAMMPGTKKSPEYQKLYNDMSSMRDHPKTYKPETLRTGFENLTKKIAATKSYDLFATDFKSMEAFAECVNLLPGNKTLVDAAKIVISAGGGEKIEKLSEQRNALADKRKKMREEENKQALESSSRASTEPSPTREEPVRPTKK